MASPRPVCLLDSNVLIALADLQHELKGPAEAWMRKMAIRFATCPITQGSLIRFYFRFAIQPSMPQAQQLLKVWTDKSEHVFLPDDLSYLDVSGIGVRGHRQVTDAYLVALARRHGVRLATFDRGLAMLHADPAELIPT